MNYSTLKRNVALSCVALLGLGAASAQDMSMSSSTSTAKLFGGRKQYNTWSFGINAGATSPVLATGGSGDYVSHDVKWGAGISLADQLAHSFGVMFDANYSRVGFSNRNAKNAAGAVINYRDNRRADLTQSLNFTISGVVNVATVDFLERKNSVNFFVKGGAGMSYFDPHLVLANGSSVEFKNGGVKGADHVVGSLIVPVGAGIKFKISDALAWNLGYNETFVDADNFDGDNFGYPTKDHFSYGYAGLEWTLGPKSKPNLQWVNPVAMMYDELYDAELRREVAALKGRVSNVENAVNDLKKDSDGDGVSDQFDKCPNTPAGTVVSGSGCEIIFPKVVEAATTGMAAPAMPAVSPYGNIQFDFDSSVLRTSSYPVLDASSSDLRSSSASVELDGFASSEGTAAHNMRLSKDRANAVKTYLVNSGVDAKRVKVKAFGETKPIADNSTEEGRVMNRRVEFKK